LNDNKRFTSKDQTMCSHIFFSRKHSSSSDHGGLKQHLNDLESKISGVSGELKEHQDEVWKFFDDNIAAIDEESRKNKDFVIGLTGSASDDMNKMKAEFLQKFNDLNMRVDSLVKGECKTLTYYFFIEGNSVCS